MCCRALGLNLSSYQYSKKTDTPDKRKIEGERIIEVLKVIFKEHSGYGYRRLVTELNEKYQIQINHKRLRSLLNEHDLAL